MTSFLVCDVADVDSFKESAPEEKKKKRKKTLEDRRSKH